MAGTSTRARAALVVTVAAYVVIDVVAAARRSPLVPPLPVGVGVPSWAARLADWSGLSDLGHGGLTLLSLLTVVVLMAAFATLLLEAMRGRVALRAVAIAIAVALALVVVAPLLLSRDAYSYALYGRTYAIHGMNPYLRPPVIVGDPFGRVVSPLWARTPSLYGPLFTLISGGIVRVFRSSAAATIASYKLLAAASVAGATALAAGAARRLRPGREVLAALLVGLNPVVLLHSVGGGHNDALIALFIAAAAFVATRLDPERPAQDVFVTVLLTLAVLVKVVMAPLLAVWLWWVWRKRRPGSQLAIHVAAAAAVTALLLIPFYAGWRTFQPFTTLASVQGWASGPGLIARGAKAAAGDAAARVVTLAFLVVFAFAGRAILTRQLLNDEPPSVRWGDIMLLFALSVPYLLPWYALWFLPLVALSPELWPVAVAAAVSAVLALTGIPAEPSPDVTLWHHMVLAVHYVAAPVVLALLLFALLRAWRPSTSDTRTSR